MCPKINDCFKATMVLDKDLAFNWQYASEMKKVCQNCTTGITAAHSSNRNMKKVVLSCS